MKFFFAPSQAAATPCLVLVTLLPTLALVIEPDPRRLQVPVTRGSGSPLINGINRCKQK